MDKLTEAIHRLQACGLLWPLVIQLVILGLALFGTSKRVLGDTTRLETWLCGLGILGAGALFALFAFMASRRGTRLEDGGSCHGDAGPLDSCALQDECGECGHAKDASGWWPDDGVKDGDRR